MVGRRQTASKAYGAVAKELGMRGEDFPEGGVLVVGGSGGIGSVIARRFAEAGCDVALTYRRNRARADEVVEAIRALGVRAEAFATDVTQPAEVGVMVAGAIGAMRRLHTVVFVAGPMPAQKYMAQVDDAEWRQAIEVELHGFYNVVRATVPHLREQGGSYVHLGSAGDLAWVSRDGLSIVPKAANEALVRGIAREEGRFGIRANSVLIGVIEAGMFLKFTAAGVFDDEYVKKTYERLALKRLGKPEEVADPVVFMASNRAAYVTGQQIAAAGGYGI